MSGQIDARTLSICCEGVSFLFGIVLVTAMARQKNRIPRNGYLISGMLMSLMGTCGSLYGLLEAGSAESGMSRAAVSEWLPAFLFLGSVLLLSQYFPGILRDKKREGPDALLLGTAVFTAAASVFLRIVRPEIQLVGTGFTFMYMLIYSHYQSRLEAELLKKRMELSESRMMLLTRQISPQFFFNALGMLEELCRRDSARAAEATRLFSDYLKQTLEALAETKLLPFEDVFGFVREYMEVRKLVLGVSVEIECRIGVSDFMIPTYILEPIVWEAIRRIDRLTDGSGRLVIETEGNAFRSIIRVTDNGMTGDGRETGESAGADIERAKARLAVLCRGEVISTRMAGRTETAIVLPREVH